MKDSKMDTETENHLQSNFEWSTNTTKIDFQHVVEAIETAAPTINEGNEDLIVPVDIVVEEERFEDGDGVERNGMTTSDNPIDTGTTTTTTKVEAE